MSYIEISNPGGIDDKELGASLTGSTTLIKSSKGILEGNSVVIDFGIHQGSKNANELNKIVDQDIINADYLIITHAHMDHIGRIPLLVKKGFKGKIIMTEITKDLSFLMWNDYIKLVQNQSEELKTGNKKKGQKFREYLKIISLNNQLEKNNLNEKEKGKITNNLSKLLNGKDLNKALYQAKKVLDENGIIAEKDIKSSLNQNIPELLYDVEDLYKTMSMIETMEIGEEKNLDSRIVITRENSEVIEKIPQIIKEGYDKKIYVLPGLKQHILNVWDSKFSEVDVYNKENKQLRADLYFALKFVTENNKNKNKLKPEDKEVYDFSLQFLEKNNISNKKDIEKLKENIKKADFNLADLKKAKERLEIILEKDNEKIVESLKLRFLDAGHIQGSVMVSLSYITKEVKNKVNSILKLFGGNGGFNGYKEVIKKHHNFLFSGDLGKITDSNLSGTPDIPELRYDYVQMESTYADRDHPNKQKEFERLIEITNRPGKKLIAAYSLDRTQEVLVMFLLNKFKNKSKIEEVRKLKKKQKEISKVYDILLNKEELTSSEALNKQKLFLDISKIEERIMEISKKCFTGFIIQDSPFASKITDVFIKYNPNVFKILDPLVQKQLFGSEQIRILERGEYKELYKPYRAKSNDVIISSGGMIQGGAIINHVKMLLGDSNATIVLSGYVAEGTLGRELLELEKELISAKDGKKEVIIDGEVFEVKCRIESVGGFSSHMGQKDLINFGGKLLNYSKDATLSLTHGDENREILKNEITKVRSKINIVVPKLGDKRKIEL